ncbi:aminotransferase class I/II-fold pyridoxal phosphate-dependent enzyme [Candidatus Nitrosocosmicus agrestis]|jgi:aspartate/methionine/tyrosine aminotransferase|uniref:aminotransferase class I/II-fold pyridoxal phosphate-dependent enzyme n=1 Tax=Candidatus Nitrosocosmicus agrestis TaxID=2563600 RepID=UPI00122E7AF0|nr:aminotransferase class I/II-fold pyridoxal phosphate-dependent enzyme [Candidatus Nitrosocosmicus sp. SS]KAA2283074.1 aminotransferase class I/II-fold pyridoxal phosphate-dependent enzyme [Candidatus Nitrosocosmicus sp. SS]KAF0868532.1 aminotransferase class I/II-fold pyridoxal phosphate-dependent enzyme [Candidatus Nitrosocosmicus sp. SS]
MRVSDRISRVEYAIRDIMLHAREYQKTGKDLMYLNIGDPVAFDFKTPNHIKSALSDALANDNDYYTDSEGWISLRNSIVTKENDRKGLELTSDDVLVTNGVSEGLDMVMGSIVEEGDHVLLPGPYYPPYSSYAKYYGGSISEFEIYDDGTPNIDDIKSKISPKSKAICIINPNNPTGEVFSQKSLKSMVDIAAENDLYVICDEIYDEIVFDGQFSGIGGVSNDAPVVLLNGFSKTYLMTGLRCGYVCMNNKSRQLDPLRQNIFKLARVRIASNLPVQIAADAALNGPQDHLPVMVHKLKKRRDLVFKRLNEIKGLYCRKPKGAFYMFPQIDLGNKWKSDLEFVIELLNSTGVLTVHGSGFGDLGKNHFRIVYLPQEEILEKSMNKIEVFMKDNYSV